MRKVIVLAATVVALASCAKNEVLPVKTSNDEITFNVAPKTKAVTDFDHSLKFKSYAYYNETGKEAQLYINDEEISYVDDDKAWKAGTPYYWPKKEGSSLTFYAWTSLKETVAVDGVSYETSYVDGVSCTSANGIKASGYDLVTNKNKDFLVADKAENQTKNSTADDTPHYNHNGVPTLFKHKLSYVVFTVKIDKDYSTTTAGSKTFTLKSIKFNSIYTKGNYTQSPEAWEAIGDASVQTYYSGDATITNNATTLTSDNTVNYYLPQEFVSTQKIVVEYEIKTTVKNSTEVTETVTREISLNSTGTEAVKPFADAKWEIGKKYTVNLTFSLDEITWDPAVEDWSNADASDITVK